MSGHNSSSRLRDLLGRQIGTVFLKHPDGSLEREQDVPAPPSRMSPLRSAAATSDTTAWIAGGTSRVARQVASSSPNRCCGEFWMSSVFVSHTPVVLDRAGRQSRDEIG